MNGISGFFIRLFFGLAVTVATSGWLAVAQTSAEDLRLTIGKSVVIDYPADVRQISTSDPAIVDANPVTTREILLHGKGLGSATMIVWSKDGQRTFYNVTVDANLDPLRRLIKETYPNEEVKVQSSRDSITLTGRVSSAQVSERIAAMAAPFGKTIVNSLQLVNGPIDKQIVLKVKFAELDRTRASQFAVNLYSVGANHTLGSIGTSQPPRPTLNDGKWTIAEAFNIFGIRSDLNMAGFIQALQTESILQILAEPNLVTTNGKEASFLVGGEFPVPVLQGGANAGAVTIMFREFGIRLLFTPHITDNKTIKMHLRQEVSTIDLANAVTFNGFTIPALSTRRAETEIELGLGQSFVVAGLIDNRDTESYAKIPGLGSLPIFGSLFKNRDLKKNRTELVMIVSPEITTPLPSMDKAPSPYFPRDFLIPITPPAISKTPAAAPAPKAAVGQHWFDPRRLTK
jgi:pilus assembly protein CpaC